MSSSTTIAVTPSKANDNDVASSSIKRDIQRHASAADEMISSIRNELFTTPGSNHEPNNSIDDDDDKSLYDDGELVDEIQRLASIEDDIRQDLNANVEKIVMETTQAKTRKTVAMSKEERTGLVLFVLIAVWIAVYAKQWIQYNYSERIET